MAVMAKDTFVNDTICGLFIKLNYENRCCCCVYHGHGAARWCVTLPLLLACCGGWWWWLHAGGRLLCPSALCLLCPLCPLCPLCLLCPQVHTYVGTRVHNCVRAKTGGLPMYGHDRSYRTYDMTLDGTGIPRASLLGI